jgi:hypothetical protein
MSETLFKFVTQYMAEKPYNEVAQFFGALGELKVISEEGLEKALESGDLDETQDPN